MVKISGLHENAGLFYALQHQKNSKNINKSQMTTLPGSTLYHNPVEGTFYD